MFIANDLHGLGVWCNGAIVMETMFVMVAQTIGYYLSKYLFYWKIIIILFLLIWPFYDLLVFFYPTWYLN